MLVVLDIFLDYILGYFVPYCPHKVSIFPKFASPQVLFNFWKHLKYPSCRSAFKALNYLRYRITRRKPQKYMHMLFGYFHLIYFKLVGLSDFLKTFSNEISKITPQYPFTISMSPYQMIPGIVYRMTRPLDCHADILIDLKPLLKDAVHPRHKCRGIHGIFFIKRGEPI